MCTGDALEIIDSAAQRFAARIEIDGARVLARLERLVPVNASTFPSVTIAQGLPKGHKMDFVVEKLTELGVARIIPMRTERSVVSQVGAQKLERWRRLAKTASAQCGRVDVPIIHEEMPFARVLAEHANVDCALLPWELAPAEPLRSTLPGLLQGARSVLVLIGPEGGFSHAEADAARAAGAHAISLGERILRTETAGLVSLTIIGYILGNA